MFGFQRKPELPWGGLEFAGKLLENTHYLLMGSSGSGKTVSLSMLLRRALESRDGLRHPAIVYDPKQSFYPELRCFSFGESPLVLSNPMDTRSSHWAIGRDYSDTVHATQLAATLIPRVSEKDRFFTDGARTFLFAVVTALQERLGTEWTLRDLVEGCSTKARLSALLSVTDEGA